jgi:hypothetical protein
VFSGVASPTKRGFRGRPTRLASVPALGLFLEPFGRPGPRLGGVLTSGAIWIELD